MPPVIFDRAAWLIAGGYERDANKVLESAFSVNEAHDGEFNPSCRKCQTFVGPKGRWKSGLANSRLDWSDEAFPAAVTILPKAIVVQQALLFGQKKPGKTKPKEPMKLQNVSFPFVAALALGLAGCSRNEPAAPAAENANKGANPTANEVAKAAETTEAEAAKPAETNEAEAAKAAETTEAEAAKAAETTEAEAAKAAETARAEVLNTEATNAGVITNVAQPTNAADDNRIQQLIDEAKSLVAESKFADASKVLQQLASQTLTDEQRKLVDSLKEQIQKALAAEATKKAADSLGNLLNK